MTLSCGKMYVAMQKAVFYVVSYEMGFVIKFEV